MNDLEKLFKDGLDDFEEATPSKSLWWRISTSLLLQKHLSKTILMLALLSMFGIYSINKVYFKDSSKTTAVSKNVANEAVAMNQSIENKTNIAKNKAIQSENPVSKSSSVKEEIQIINNKIQITKNKTQITNTEQQTTNSEQQTTNNEQISNQPPFRAGEKLITANSKTQISNQPPSRAGEKLITTNSKQPEPSGVDVQNLISSLEYQKPKEWKNNGSDVILSPALIPFNRHPKQHSQYLEVYAGPTLNQFNLSTSNPDFREYINYRNNSETQKITPNFGINYRYIFKNWFFTGGASYHQIRTDADYLLPIVVVDSTINFFSIVRMNYTYQVIGTMPDPNNPNVFIPIYGTVSNPDTTQYSEIFRDTNSVMKDFHYSQKYTFVEIPIMIGREFRYKDFVFETALGVSYSRLTKYETKLPDLTTQNLLSDVEIENILVQNSFNGIFGFGAAYQLTENKAVFIRPEFKYNLNSMLNKSFPINQRNSQMRVVMGIRYEL